MIAELWVLNTKCCPQGYSPRREFIHILCTRKTPITTRVSRVFGDQGAKENIHPLQALVDKFFFRGGEKTAGWN
jgi:hypothetical protein